MFKSPQLSLFFGKFGKSDDNKKKIVKTNDDTQSDGCIHMHSVK